MVTHNCNPSTLGGQGGDDLSSGVRAQEFETSLVTDMVKPHLY